MLARRVHLGRLVKTKMDDGVQILSPETNGNERPDPPDKTDHLTTQIGRTININYGAGRKLRASGCQK